MSNPRKNHAHGVNLAVAQALTAARKGAGYTNESLAAAIPDISLTSLQRYLSGRSAIDVEVLTKMCLVIGVNEVEIIKAAQKIRAGELIDQITGKALKPTEAVAVLVDAITGEVLEPGDAVGVHISAKTRDDQPNMIFISHATHANFDVQQASRFFGYRPAQGEQDDERHLTAVAANETDAGQQEPGAAED